MAEWGHMQLPGVGELCHGRPAGNGGAPLPSGSSAVARQEYTLRGGVGVKSVAFYHREPPPASGGGEWFRSRGRLRGAARRAFRAEGPVQARQRRE